MEGVKYTGVPSRAELDACPGRPSEERMKKGRVACIECVQEIPCNPCEGICRFGAITVGEQITNLPVLDEEKCTGCGLCVANCPGLAIVVLDKSYSETEGTVDFPYEYLPLPEKGDIVDAVNRSGEVVCKGEVLSVTKLKSYAGTAVIRLKVPLDMVDEVRSIPRLRDVEKIADSEDARDAEKENLIICRCQEVTEQEILDAIRDGAVTVDGVKRRTRAGMGLCQGKTCGRLVQRMIAQQTGQKAEDVVPQKSRMPVRPVRTGMFEDEKKA